MQGILMKKIFRQRSGVDRRRIEAGPPGKYDRRRTPEQRRPEVTEGDFEEWEALVSGGNRQMIFNPPEDDDSYDWPRTAVK